jgi:serine/threonine-protein kinase
MEGMPMPGTALPAIGDEIAGKYRIESVLGQGGMGAVFAARNALTGKRVAIKWLLPEHAASTSRERLLREAQIAASIDHPNVVDIYDVGEHQGGLFLVMEYLRGRNLADVLAERGRLDPEELITLMVPAMRGVHAAHRAGVVHRDLKPENIILSEGSDGHIVPKVVDFGVSKTVGTSGVPHSSLTRTGALVGTPHFMALEQVDGTNLIDGRTDVYAFGVLLYRALTGHFPFDGSSLGEVILKIGTKDPVPMRMLRQDLPQELDNIVLRALMRDRTRRFSNLDELSRALMPFAPGARLRDTSETSISSASLQPVREPLSRSGAVPVISGSGNSAPELSLRGNAPELPVSPSMLGAAVSLDGVTVARTTPVNSAAVPGRGRMVWAVVAALLIGLVGGGSWLLLRDASPAVADLPAQKTTPMPKGEELGAGAAAPLPAAAAAPVAALPEGSGGGEARGSAREQNKAEPALAQPSELPSDGSALQKSSDPSANEAIMEPAQAMGSAPADRSKRTRVQPNVKARSVKLIPGDRTKGLSVDEF